MVDEERTAEFAAFYRRTYSLVLSTVERRVRGRAVAEDVTAEVFRVAWQHHAAGGDLGLPWLYGVARNVIGNEYRRTMRSRNLHERLRENDAVEASPGADDALDVLRALARLRAGDREILQLVYWDDLTSEEVASVLDITPSTARVRLLRARAALRQVLEPTEVSAHG